MVLRATVGSCRSVDVLSRSRPARSPGASSDGRCWLIWYRSTRCTPCCSRTRACPMRRSRRCSPCGPRSGSSPRSPPGRSRTASAAAPHSSSARSCRRSAMRPGSCSPSFPASRWASCCGDWAAPSRRVRRRRCCTTGWSQSGPRSTTPGSRAGSARRGWSCRCRRPGSRRHCSSPVVIPRPGGRAWRPASVPLSWPLGFRNPATGRRRPHHREDGADGRRRTWRLLRDGVADVVARGRRSSARCWRSACSTGWTRSRSTSRWWPAIYGCPPRWCPWRCSPCRSSAQWAPLSEVRRTDSAPERSRSCWRPVPPCSQERRRSRIRWLWSASRCTTACTARSWWSPTPACRNGSRGRPARR